MAFGENVGSAYVKLYADGDDVPDDIRKAMDKIEPEFRRAGEEHAKAFDDAWNKQREKDGPKMRDNLAKDLQKGLGRFGAIGEQLGDDLFDGIQIQLSRELENNDLGKQIRDNLEKGFEETGSFDQLRSRLRDLNGEIIRASDQLDKKFEKELRDSIRETDDLTDSTINWRKSVEDTRDAMRELAGEIDNGWEHTNKWVREIALARDESSDFSIGFRNHLHNLNVELDKSATLTGKIFGKGSRNDFFNLLGASVEGLTRLVYATPNLVERLLGGGSGGSGGGGAILKGIASSIVGITIAVTALVAIAGPVAALISGISAAVIALAGSLVFAAGAVGGVALALAGPLVAAIGVGVLAITNLDKKADDAFAKLIDNFQGLGKVAGHAIGPGLAEAAELSAGPLKALTPLIEDISGALGDVAVMWAKGLDSPAFRKFQEAAQGFFPDAIRSMGQIVENVLGGVAGIARAAIPITTNFLDYLVEQTQKFSDWANSIEGQNSLGQFFDRAADSAQVVWDAIRDVSEAVIDLLNLGKDSGDDIFTSLAENAQEFVDWLNDPKNQDSINSFFANGVEVAQALGDLILDIQGLIDNFDTEETRAELQALFDLLSDVITVTGDAALVVTNQWHTLTTVLGGVWQVLTDVGQAAKDTGELIVDAVRAPDRGLTALREKLSSIDWGGVASAAEKAFSSVAQSALNARTKTLAWFQGLGNRIERGIGNVDWSGIIKDPTAKVVGWFKGLAGDLAKAAGDVDWSGIIKDPTDKIVGWFTGLGGRILSAIGHIDLTSLMHGSINLPGPGGKFSWATGGIADRPMIRQIGEAGAEAVVPLNRPLSMVDPSVRALSAIAQGLAAPSGGSGGVRVEEGAITVYEAADGRATASAMLNSLVALAY